MKQKKEAPAKGTKPAATKKTAASKKTAKPVNVSPEQELAPKGVVIAVIPPDDEPEQTAQDIIASAFVSDEPDGGLPVEPETITPPVAPDPAPEPVDARLTRQWTDDQVKAGQDKFFANLKNDNVFVDAKIVPLTDLTGGMPVRQGITQAVVSEGRIVNVISDSYGFVDNRDYFLKVEESLIEADIYYKTRSVNRDNRSFSVDYILSDDRYHVNVKGGIDKIMPMLSFTNAYDGSGPCTGRFGFFRMVCMNGLHIAKTNIGFKVRHKRDVNEIVIEGIKDSVRKFMDNEYYSLHKKFELMSQQELPDLHKFVKWTAETMDLFKFEKGKSEDKVPSAKAEEVLNIIRKEARELNTVPNLWLGYNAFNEIIHASGQPFQKQRQLDSVLFDTVMEYAG